MKYLKILVLIGIIGSLIGCTRFSPLIGRWELVDVTNVPFGTVVAREIEFFSDGTGRMHFDIWGFSTTTAFTWSTEAGRVRMEGDDIPTQINDFQISGEMLTFIYDRTNNFTSLYRRASR